MLAFLTLLSAALVGGVVYLTAGQAPAIGVAVLLLVAGVVAHLTSGGARRGIGAVLLIAMLGAGAYGGVLAIDVLDAVNTTEGVADAADPDLLTSAESKLSDLASTSAFRLELTEPELQAVVQDGVAASSSAPIQRVDLDLRGATRDLAFVATFKAGDLQASGTAAVTAVDGGIDLDLGPLEFGSIEVPGVAAGAIESLLGAVTDLNAALAEQRASVQAIEITDDLLVVIGTRATTDVLTNDDLLGAIRDQAAVAADSVQAPPERIGPGTLAGLDEPGDPVILAVGDSLAANVGVDDNRLGFVSRVHAALAERDAAAYGLVNLGVPGETSGTMLSSGQLAAAEARLAAREAAYVLVDIGANDLLGHLTSPECGTDLATPECQRVIEQTLVAYRENLARVLDRLTAAAGEARIVFLQAYNPFSLGIGESQQERESSAILQRLNAVAAEEAARRGVTVADGFTPMQGTTAATTHMLDPEPDIHPNASGYDVLAGAIMDSL